MGYDTLDMGIRTVVVLGLAFGLGYVCGAARPWLIDALSPAPPDDVVTELAGARDRRRVELMRLRQRYDPQRPGNTRVSFYGSETGLEAKRRAWGDGEDRR